MARVYAFRLLIALLGLIAALLLTSLAYELVVTARWNPHTGRRGENRAGHSSSTKTAAATRAPCLSPSTIFRSVSPIRPRAPRRSSAR